MRTTSPDLMRLKTAMASACDRPTRDSPFTAKISSPGRRKNANFTLRTLTLLQVDGEALSVKDGTLNLYWNIRLPHWRLIVVVVAVALIVATVAIVVVEVALIVAIVAIVVVAVA